MCARVKGLQGPSPLQRSVANPPIRQAFESTPGVPLGAQTTRGSLHFSEARQAGGQSAPGRWRDTALGRKVRPDAGRAW